MVELKDGPLGYLQENLQQTLSSLMEGSLDAPAFTAARVSVPHVPEICFISDDSNTESMSSWLDNRVTSDKESPLLRCESCKVFVHASELVPFFHSY